jgi:hypothetical protein
MRARELAQRGHEVPARQPVQVQQRQHLRHLRGLARPRRQDRRAEPPPLTGDRVGALVVHPRCGHLHRARASQHRTRLRGAVAHHQPVSFHVPQVSELVDVSTDFRPQRAASIARAPSRTIWSITDNGSRADTTAGRSGTTVSADTGVPSRPALQRRPLLETAYDSIIREGTPSFMLAPFPVSSIAPAPGTVTRGGLARSRSAGCPASARTHKRATLGTCGLDAKPSPDALRSGIGQRTRLARRLGVHYGVGFPANAEVTDRRTNS